MSFCHKDEPLTYQQNRQDVVLVHAPIDKQHSFTLGSVTISHVWFCCNANISSSIATFLLGWDKASLMDLEIECESNETTRE